MSLVAVKRSLIALLLLATAPMARGQEPEADDARLRARARAEWYNETPRGRAPEGRAAGLRGPWSPSFRRFMMEAAARERQKWGDLIPGNGGWTAGAAPADRAEGGVASWLNLGPTRADYISNGGITLLVTDSGRVRSIVPHPQDPNVLYVAFSGGGVWKTVNGGATWAPVTEAVGSLSVGWLAMDPANPNTLYLGLGDPFDGTGIGLVKTTDGGANWSSPVFLGDSTVILQVFVSPAGPNVVLVATDKGLFRSTDAGASFSLVPVATGQPQPPYVWSLASTGGTGLVMSLEATVNTSSGQIWYSSDSGVTWRRGQNVASAAGISRMTVASAPSSPTVVYALASTNAGDLADVFRSTNGGQYWRSLQATAPRTAYKNFAGSRPSLIFNTQGWYDQMLIVDPANPNRVFFGGALQTARLVVGGALGGRTWSVVSEWLGRFGFPYVHADAHAAAYDAAGSLYFGTDGGIFKSSDNGATFTDTMNVGIISHLVYNLGSATANRSLVVGGFQDNGTRTRSGTTSVFNQTIGGDGFGCDINVGDPTKVLGSLYYARVQKSTDGGLHFTQACSGIPECTTANAPFYTKIVPWTGSPTGDVVFTHSNTILYRSTNYADSWTGSTPVPANTIRNVGVAQGNLNVVGLVTSGGHTYLSTNGGSSWTEAAVVPNNGLSLSFIWFDRVDSSILYVASVAPDQTRTHLWKSVNFGGSWTAIDGGGFPTGIPVDVVKTDASNPDVVYAGTHLGVYRSDDGGATWVRFGAGMPLVEVTDVYVSGDSSLVRASTYGRGFWELIP